MPSTEWKVRLAICTIATGLALGTVYSTVSRDNEVQTIVTAEPSQPEPTRLKSGKSSLDPSSLETDMVKKVNSVRLAERLNQLTIDQILVDVARKRSLEISEPGWFSHERKDGTSMFPLILEAGFNYELSAENIAHNNTKLEDATNYAFGNLMDSPPHRENLLRPDFENIGVGYTLADSHHYFALLLAKLMR